MDLSEPSPLPFSLPAVLFVSFVLMLELRSKLGILRLYRCCYCCLLLSVCSVCIQDDLLNCVNFCFIPPAGLWQSFWNSQVRQEWWMEPVFIILLEWGPMASLQGHYAPTTVSSPICACVSACVWVQSLLTAELCFYPLSAVLCVLWLSSVTVN